MNNNRPQFVASLCPLLSRGSLLFFPGGLSSSPVLFSQLFPEPDEMVSDEQQSSPVCCFNLSISLTRFATVFPGGLSSSQFYRLKLSVIVLVLRCDHRVVVTLGRGLAHNDSNGVIQGDLYPATRVQLMQSGSDQTIHVRVM
jgi:hypothetical protein